MLGFCCGTSVEDVKGSGTQEEGARMDFSIPGGVGEVKVPDVHGRVIGPKRRSSKGKWTKEEDETLHDAVKMYNAKHWKEIAACLPNRTDVQCLHRWHKVLNPALHKGPWTKEEDDLIIELAGKQGNMKWVEIAKHIPGRIGKQCRERWKNHLNPNIKKVPWTREEESILLSAHAEYGNKWAEIAKRLCGRSENAIKNHWNCSLKKKLENYKINRSACFVHHPPSPVRNLVPQDDFTTFLPPFPSPQLSSSMPVSPPSCSEARAPSESCPSPKSRLRSAARTYDNIPSIFIRRRTSTPPLWGCISAPNKASVSLNASDTTDSYNSLSDPAQQSTQNHLKFEKSEAIKSVGKSLEQDFQDA